MSDEGGARERTPARAEAEMEKPRPGMNAGGTGDLDEGTEEGCRGLGGDAEVATQQGESSWARVDRGQTEGRAWGGSAEAADLAPVESDGREGEMKWLRAWKKTGEMKDRVEPDDLERTRIADEVDREEANPDRARADGLDLLEGIAAVWKMVAAAGRHWRRRFREVVATSKQGRSSWMRASGFSGGRGKPVLWGWRRMAVEAMGG